MGEKKKERKIQKKNGNKECVCVYVLSPAAHRFLSPKLFFFRPFFVPQLWPKLLKASTSSELWTVNTPKPQVVRRIPFGGHGDVKRSKSWTFRGSTAQACCAWNRRGRPPEREAGEHFPPQQGVGVQVSPFGDTGTERLGRSALERKRMSIRDQ